VNIILRCTRNFSTASWRRTSRIPPCY